MLKESNKQLVTIVLAAGKGTRMKTDLPKVLHLVDNKPMILHVIDLAQNLNSETIIAILGYKRDLIIECIKSENVLYVVQEPQLGTGHAVLQAESLLKDFTGDILVLSGDVPLLRKYSVQRMLGSH